MGHLANYASVGFLWHIITIYKHKHVSVVINSRSLKGAYQVHRV